MRERRFERCVEGPRDRWTAIRPARACAEGYQFERGYMRHRCRRRSSREGGAGLVNAGATGDVRALDSVATTVAMDCDRHWLLKFDGVAADGECTELSDSLATTAGCALRPTTSIRRAQPGSEMTVEMQARTMRRRLRSHFNENLALRRRRTRAWSRLDQIHMQTFGALCQRATTTDRNAGAYGYEQVMQVIRRHSGLDCMSAVASSSDLSASHGPSPNMRVARNSGRHHVDRVHLTRS